MTSPSDGTPYTFRLDDLREAATTAHQRWEVGRPERTPIDREPCLYHYTSAEGLQGILRARALWATDTAFLNDWKEIAYAAEPLVKRIRDRQAEQMKPYVRNGELDTRLIPDKPSLDRILALQTVASFIDDFTGPDRERVVRENDLYLTGATFVACLSDDHDQLGQWRGYGQGGYAIGFWRDRLAEAAPILGAVQYGDDAVNTLCDRVIEHLDGRDVAADNLERDRDTYVEAVSYCLPLIALIKHGSFEQENEWRLVVPRYDLDYTGMKVRTAGGQLVPYVECSFERTAIAEIVIGPGGDLHSERAVRALLFANGYDPDTIQVSYSAAPFRG